MLFYWSFEGTQYALPGKSIAFKLDFMTWTQKHMFKATLVWKLTLSYPWADPKGVGTESQDPPPPQFSKKKKGVYLLEAFFRGFCDGILPAQKIAFRKMSDPWVRTRKKYRSIYWKRIKSVCPMTFCNGPIIPIHNCCLVPYKKVAPYFHVRWSILCRACMILSQYAPRFWDSILCMHAYTKCYLGSFYVW